MNQHKQTSVVKKSRVSVDVSQKSSVLPMSDFADQLLKVLPSFSSGFENELKDAMAKILPPGKTFTLVGADAVSTRTSGRGIKIRHVGPQIQPVRESIGEQNLSSARMQYVDSSSNPEFMAQETLLSDLKVAPVSINEYTTSERQYSDVRGGISTVVRDELGFVHILNKNGSFYAISEQSLEALKDQGVLMVKTQKVSKMNNMSMYQRVGSGDPLALPTPDYSNVRRGVRAERSDAMNQLLTSRTDDHVEHSS
jgi:hypothetical protein